MTLIDFISKYDLSYIDLIIKIDKLTITYIKQEIRELIWLPSFNKIKDRKIKKWQPLGPITYYIELDEKNNNNPNNSFNIYYPPMEGLYKERKKK